MKFKKNAVIGTILLGTAIAAPTFIGLKESGALENISLFRNNTSRAVSVTTPQEFDDAIRNNEDISLEENLDFEGMELEQVPSYTGSIDGNYHTIKNLNTIDPLTETYDSSFYYINNLQDASIVDLTFTNSFAFANNATNIYMDYVSISDMTVNYWGNSMDANENTGMFFGSIVDSEVSDLTISNNTLSNSIMNVGILPDIDDHLNFGLFAGYAENTTFEDVILDQNTLDSNNWTNNTGLPLTTNEVNIGMLSGEMVDCDIEDIASTKNTFISNSFAMDINLGTIAGHAENISIRDGYNVSSQFENFNFTNPFFSLDSSVGTEFGIVTNASSSITEFMSGYHYGSYGQVQTGFASINPLATVEEGYIIESQIGNNNALLDEYQETELNAGFWVNYWVNENNGFWDEHDYFVQSSSFPTEILELNDNYGVPIVEDTVLFKMQITTEQTGDFTTYKLQSNLTSLNNLSNESEIIQDLTVTVNTIFGDSLTISLDQFNNNTVSFRVPQNSFTLSQIEQRLQYWTWIEVDGYDLSWWAEDNLVLENYALSTESREYVSPNLTIDSSFDPSTQQITFSTTQDNTITELDQQIAKSLVIPSENLFSINSSESSQSQFTGSLLNYNFLNTYQLPYYIDSIERLNTWYYFDNSSLEYQYFTGAPLAQESVFAIDPTSDLQSTQATSISDSTFTLETENDEVNDEIDFNFLISDQNNRFITGSESNITFTIESYFYLFEDEAGGFTNTMTFSLNEDFVNNGDGSYTYSLPIATTNLTDNLLDDYFSITYTIDGVDYILGPDSGVQTDYQTLLLDGDLTNTTGLEVYNLDSQYSNVVETLYDSEASTLTISLKNDLPYEYLISFDLAFDIYDFDGIIQTIYFNELNMDSVWVVDVDPAIADALAADPSTTLDDYLYFEMSSTINSQITYLDAQGNQSILAIDDFNDKTNYDLSIEGDLTNTTNSEVMDPNGASAPTVQPEDNSGFDYWALTVLVASGALLGIIGGITILKPF